MSEENKKILIIGAGSATACSFIKKYISDANDYFFCDMSKATDSMISGSWCQIDLSNTEEVYKIIKEIKPDLIYNFAGTFSNDYDLDYSANVLLPKSILDSIIKLEYKTRVLLIGSSAEYGCVEESDNPVNEDHKLNPVSVYGLTKVFQTKMMRFYFEKFNVNVVMARTFNLLSKNMSEKLFVGRVYRLIEEYKSNKIDFITLGNLQNKRDYIDTEKAVEMYKKIMDKGVAGEIYNVGSGNSIKIEDLLKNILLQNDLSMDIVKTEHFDNRFDIKNIYADISKVKILFK